MAGCRFVHFCGVHACGLSRRRRLNGGDLAVPGDTARQRSHATMRMAFFFPIPFPMQFHARDQAAQAHVSGTGGKVELLVHHSAWCTADTTAHQTRTTVSKQTTPIQSPTTKLELFWSTSAVHSLYVHLRNRSPIPSQLDLLYFPGAALTHTADMSSTELRMSYVSLVRRPWQCGSVSSAHCVPCGRTCRHRHKRTPAPSATTLIILDLVEASARFALARHRGFTSHRPIFEVAI